MTLHLGRSKDRMDEPDMTELEALKASRPGSGEDLAAIVARNAEPWIRARIDRGQAGTRPSVWWGVVAPGEHPSLLRVLVHPHARVQEVHESEAAVLHRLGLLWEEEEALWAAGVLAREHCYLSDQAQRDPGVVAVDASRWAAMTQAEHLELVAKVRWKPPAATVGEAVPA